MTGISRRRLLEGLAGTGLLGAAGLASVVPSSAAVRAPSHPARGIPAGAGSGTGPLPSRVDVVVVGAGISGLVAARELRRAGRTVQVLEARDRVGGRVLNHPLSGGQVIESGGAFVGPTQDHVLALLEELGIATFKEYDRGQNVYVAHGLTLRYTGTVPPDPTILPDAARLQLQLDDMARQVPVAAPWEAPQAAEWDAKSFDTWLRENTANPATRTLLLSWLQPLVGADPAEMSLLYLVWYVATAGNADHPGTFERSASTGGGAQDSRVVGGSGRIPLRLADQLGDAVALGAPVRRIGQDDGGVEVVTDRGTVTASRVVVAVPPPLAAAIDWAPALPPLHAQLLHRLPMGSLMKCDAVYERPFWREAGLSGQGLIDSGPVRVSFDNSPPDGSVGVLLGFVGGSTWRDWGNRPLAERRQGILQAFAQIVGPQALDAVDYVEHDWTHEPWSTGGPTAVAGTGVITGYGRHIREPHGRVHWAGTETATYWTGYMDGAVSAGLRAAREVLDAG
ncbi:flavin monoamine oxidase family protein [Oryzihumus sp.]|uniref:flavin monoamine oxidase family protein n=1 Tax=Oryzihumus sp. TaxID=1968903 RepID=UPI002EDA6687